MALITNKAERFESGVDGSAPAEWFGKATLDGARGPWAEQPIGSRYTEKTATGQKMYRRVKSSHASLGARTDDWAMLLGVLTQTVKVSEFTDGGGTSGTFVLTPTIPVGAYVLNTTLIYVTGFAGDVSATITVGDGSDVDRYNTGTPSVFSTVAQLAMGVPSGTKEHATAATITLTITSNSDFTLVQTNGSGQLTIRIYYLN